MTTKERAKSTRSDTKSEKSTKTKQTKTERILQKARRAGGGSSIKGITVIRLDKLETNYPSVMARSRTRSRSTSSHSSREEENGHRRGSTKRARKRSRPSRSSSRSRSRSRSRSGSQTRHREKNRGERDRGDRADRADRDKDRDRDRDRGEHGGRDARDARDARDRDRDRDRERDRERMSRREKRRRASGHEGEKQDSGRSRSGSRDSDRTPLDKHENEQIRAAWKDVTSNRRNFDSWMQLLNLVDQANDVDSARLIFNDFLDRYPYCYGYWKKFAEMEKRNGNMAEAVEVYERSVNAIPLSIDLWLAFLEFMKSHADGDGDANRLRNLYNRALITAGLEYNSDRLWADAITWEEGQRNLRGVASIYDRLIRTPTAAYKSHFERYEAIINLNQPNDLLSEEEYDEILGQVQKSCNLGIDQLIIEEEVQVQTESVEDGQEPIVQTITKKTHHPDALIQFRVEIISRRRKWHLDTTALVTARQQFEEQIKRPYFHVKPLEKSQLRNWNAYLDFEIEQGDKQRAKVLFERCLIACALYEDFWIKYARWIWKVESSDSNARCVYRRAIQSLPRRVNLRLAYSAFEEALGDYAKALSILETFNKKYPGYATVQIRIIGVHRRRAEMENEKRDAGNGKKPDYSDVISKWEELIHAPETPRHLSSYYSIKLARFHVKCRSDRRLAEKIIKRALERDRDNYQLLLQLIDLAYTNPEFSQREVMEAFDYALKAKLSDAEKLRISQRKIDFLEDLSYDIELLQEAQEKHHMLIRELENVPSTTRKRTYEKEDRDSRSARSYGSGASAMAMQPQMQATAYYPAAQTYYPQPGYMPQQYAQPQGYYASNGYAGF